MSKKLIQVGFRKSHNGIPSGVFFRFKEGGARSGFGGYCSKEKADLILAHFPSELKTEESRATGTFINGDFSGNELAKGVE